MKKILLASAASFAFAGAAAADITFSGSANVGFGDLNETAPLVAEDAVLLYQNISVTTSMSGETDTGLAFGASITFRAGDDLDLDAGDLNNDGTLSDISFGNVFISGDWGKLTFDRDGLDNLNDDDYSHDLQYDYSFDAVSVSLTYDFNAKTAADGEKFSLKLAYSADPFSASITTEDGGDFDVTLGYQITSEIKVSYTYESDNEENTIKGVYDNGTFNASLALSDTDSEWDLGLGYTANGITIGANYGDQDTGDESWDLSASYDLGGGLTVKAMTNESEAYYVGLAMSF
jgi:outer membrane protein OmpU